ncbi:hypothetical protein FACS1894153_3850 [Bacteroidia bacterium]|nr:hypothetical protein FACS1894153_3850 [Bacteroidia bacterium]
MENKDIKIIINLFIIILLPMQVYSQTKFTLQEYAIKDSSFYNDLCSVLFSDTVFSTKLNSYRYLGVSYDTINNRYDYLTGETFYAPLNIFELMDGSDIIRTTKAGKATTGYCYIENKICFILKSTQIDFINQYFILTDKKKQFKFYDSFPCVGGFTDVYMDILPSGKIKVIKVLKSE